MDAAHQWYMLVELHKLPPTPTIISLSLCPYGVLRPTVLVETCDLFLVQIPLLPVFTLIRSILVVVAVLATVITQVCHHCIH